MKKALPHKQLHTLLYKMAIVNQYRHLEARIIQLVVQTYQPLYHTYILSLVYICMHVGLWDYAIIVKEVLFVLTLTNYDLAFFMNQRYLHPFKIDLPYELSIGSKRIQTRIIVQWKMMHN